MKMDNLDRKLLALMAGDGRIPSAEMARVVGEDKRKVTYRVNRLIEEGAISIFGVVNAELFGYGIMADVLLLVEPGELDEVANRLAEHPEVRYVQSAFGEADISAEVYARNTTELHSFVSEKLAEIPGISRIRTSVVSKIYKDLHKWLPPEVQEAQNLLDGHPER
jgi:DNA-binding Lrp family transcriptional regulator